MAARNVKAGQAFDPAEKMQSNTLKRHPKMDLNKNDLLRLLSYLEGELQARDVVIATLKAEKAKQLLYQAKYGRFGLGDPFMALQRDSDNMKDNSFDETAIKSMYDNQLAQLENLIATQRKAQLKMREQLAAAEKRYHKVCAELEDEKRKHAQDTAQGDDVTYMLEKERERLKQEVDFEKSQNRRFEKDLKKTLASLEEERANSAKHKQVALMLIRERKKLVERILEEKQKCAVLEHLMNDEKNKMLNMAEGLVQESKKSLRMEAAMEKQLSDFDAEREQLKSRAIQEEGRNKDLVSQVDSLKQQLEQLQKELQQQRIISRDSIQSIEIKSTASSKQGSREQSVDRSATPLPSPIAVTVPKLPQYMPPGSIILETSDRIPTGTMLENKRPVTTQLGNSPVVSPEKYIVSPGEITVQPDIRVMSSTALVEGAAGPRISLSAGGTTVLSTPGGKISFHVGQPGISRKASSVGRGTPPPIPPNKPILVASPSAKPAIPPKVGVTVTKDRVTLSGSEADLATRSPAKSMQIPVSVVANQSNVTSSRTSPREGSPMRKTTQLLASQLVNTADDTNLSSPSTLDFLGPEIADLQQVLVALATGESDSPVAIDSPSLTTTSSSLSQTHKYAACSNLEEMNQLLSERKSSVNLLTKDSSLLVSTAETGQEKNLKFLLDLGADPNISTATTSALHAAARAGHCGCILLLLDYGACVNQPDHSGWTPLHWAAAHGHIDCCQLLLDSGAKLDTQNKMNWTVLHAAAQNGHAQCLELFVDGTATGDVQPVCGAQAETPPPDHLNLVHKQDDDGCTPCHLAAMRDSKDCLEVLLKMNVDLDVTDGLGRTVHDVASRACKHLLDKYVETQQKLCTVVIDFEESNEESKGAQQYVIGSLKVSPDTTWSFFTECICSTLLSYYKSLDNGLKTKKITRLDPDLSPGRTPFTLGISMDSIKCFRLGMYEWTPGQSLDTKPFTLISNSDVNSVSVVIKGVKKCSVSLAFSLLLPVPAVQSYLRLLEQYKNVVFYGPDHTQKKNLVCHLANSLAEKELNEGRQPRMVHVKLHHKFSNSDFITVLKEKGCMVPVKTENTDKTAPILILENLELVRIPEVMQNLLSAIEHRGQTYTFKLKGDNGVFTTYFLVEKLYILGTMNKTRSSGLDVSFQHRFRWVQFRIDMEPIRGLLSRHLLRKLLNSHQGQLPPSDNSVFKAVEWVICVWQRLNDGLGKLGLPEIVFGPTIFFNCPVENDQPEAIFWWLTKVWNQYISPVVHGVITSQHTGKETAAANSQHKVANTALYVLMQRAVVSGCPLTGKEKTAYLSEFNGSSKLDTPVKIDKSPTGSLPHSSGYITRLSSQTKKEPSKSLEVNCVSNLSSKRSLSESSVLKKYWEPVRSESELSESMPKVRKLEFRSPFLRSFGCANPCSKFFGTSRTSSVSGPDFLKVKNSLSPCGDHRSSKSQSTENLHSGRTLSSSPFSFSLTTSTPPLNSFKFFEGTAESGLRESTGRSDKQCVPTELESRAVDTSHPDREVLQVSLLQQNQKFFHWMRIRYMMASREKIKMTRFNHKACFLDQKPPLNIQPGVFVGIVTSRRGLLLNSQSLLGSRSSNCQNLPNIKVREPAVFLDKLKALIEDELRGLLATAFSVDGDACLKVQISKEEQFVSGLKAAKDVLTLLFCSNAAGDLNTKHY